MGWWLMYPIYRRYSIVDTMSVTEHVCCVCQMAFSHIHSIVKITNGLTTTEARWCHGEYIFI